MNASKKFVIGLGIASGALLTVWLLTGNRKQKTKRFLSEKAVTLKNAIKPDPPKRSFDDSDTHYI